MNDPDDKNVAAVDPVDYPVVFVNEVAVIGVEKLIFAYELMPFGEEFERKRPGLDLAQK